MEESALERIIPLCTETLDFVSQQEIPKSVWKNCAGIAVINFTERGFVFSFGEGEGVVLKKNNDGSWGAPSCLVFTSINAGAIFGIGAKKLVLFPMTDHALKQLTANTKYQLGAHAGLTVGKYGREFGAALDAGGHGVGATVSYVFSEGALLDIGMTNNTIENIDEQNKLFYRKPVSANEIVFDGAVNVPTGKGVEELQAKLAEICKQ